MSERPDDCSPICGVSLVPPHPTAHRPRRSVRGVETKWQFQERYTFAQPPLCRGMIYYGRVFIAAASAVCALPPLEESPRPESLLESSGALRGLWEGLG